MISLVNIPLAFFAFIWFAINITFALNTDQTYKEDAEVLKPYPNSIVPKALAYLTFHQLTDECFVRDDYYDKFFILSDLLDEKYKEIVQKDIIVLSPLSDERIKRQSGAFIMFGNSNYNTEKNVVTV